MTKRELELLHLIETNPLISQKELAQHLGIERSSVAVHISNLIKKGIIKGKGYIIEKQPYLLVIGGANMDILGIPEKTLTMEDSNPGYISASPGGVGRNIAENMGHLGLSTKLLTVVGDDLYGSQLLELTKQAGVDVDYIKQCKTIPTSTYMSILDETGNMSVALSDMRIMNELNSTYLKEVDEIIRQAQIIVLDTNLEEEVLRYLVTSYPESLFIVDTVSTAKAMKIKSLLPYLYCIKPNRIEAEILYGQPIQTSSDIQDALNFFKHSGIEHPMISLGAQGVAFLIDTTCMLATQSPLSVINVNGAGDAFTAGLAYGLFHNMPLSETVEIASAAARLTLTEKTTVNPLLSMDLIHQILDQQLIIQKEEKGDNIC